MLIVVVPFQDQGCGSHPFHSSPRSRPSCEPILQVEVGAKQGSLYDTPPKLLETKKKKGKSLKLTTHFAIVWSWLQVVTFHFHNPWGPFYWRFGGKNSPPKHQPIQPYIIQTSARGLDHGGFEDGFVRNGTQPGWHWHLGERSRWGLPRGDVTWCVCHVLVGDSCR